MKKKILIISITLILITLLPAQQNAKYDNLKKIFVSGTITDKSEVLDKAASEQGAESLIVDGLSFADMYASLLSNEQHMIDLASKAVSYADLYDGAETYNLVTDIFQKYSDIKVRQACLNYLLKTKRLSDKTAPVIEQYAMELLNDGGVEEDTMLSCLSVLEKIHSNSSFRTFFDYASSTFISWKLQSVARAAMTSLTDVYRINMLSIIKDSPVPNKLSALQLVLANEMNSDILCAEAAETALSTSIIHVGDTFDTALTDLQMTALGELRRLSWTRSANLVADYFAVARDEFEDGILPSSQFIIVIETVKELSVVKAGSLLADYLNYCNANVENGLSCSVPVVLAVIKSLGALGDKVAFDALLYVSYVPYPDEVILASREALARLKW